jgi:hypothetical protein
MSNAAGNGRVKVQKQMSQDDLELEFLKISTWREPIGIVDVAGRW